jgi:hypothetical protein
VEHLPLTPTTIEGVCTRRLMDDASPDFLARRVAAEVLYEALTPDQQGLVNLGGTARTFVISTPDLDRHRTMFLPDAWELDAYRANPVVLWSHRYGDLPVGLSGGAAMGADKMLRSTVVLLPESVDPFAAKIDRMISLGVIRAASIGATVSELAFVENEETGDWWVEFRKVELVEWSIATVPSNRNALLDSARTAQALGMGASQARAFLQQATDLGMRNMAPQVEPPQVSDPWDAFTLPV